MPARVDLLVTEMPPLPTRARTAAASPWRIGETLEAVARVGPSGRMALEIGGRMFVARGAEGLEAGQPLRLAVVGLAPRPLLRVMSPSASRQARVVAEALRRYLPRERPPGATLGAALRVVRSPQPALARAAGALLAAVPTRADLAHPDLLRSAIARAGTSWERRVAAALGRPAADWQVDLKPLFGRFAAALRVAAARAPSRPPGAGGAADGDGQERPSSSAEPAGSGVTRAASQPPSPPASAPELLALADEADGALARIWSNQLRPLRAREQHETPTWRVDIPVRHGERFENLTVVIERAPRRRRGGGPASARWSVEVHADLGRLGGLRARVGLAGESVSATLWAEREQTARILAAHLDELAEGLRGRGLRSCALHARSAPRGAQASRGAPPGPLLETEA